jgi:hypothetical protein
MRKLLPPSCPAKFRWEADHPLHSQTFDHGKIAHALVLGDGDVEIAVVDAKDWRTKKAQQQRDDAWAAEQIPILAADYQICVEMAAAVRAHPIAGPLFAAGTGRPEQTLRWADPLTGVATNRPPSGVRMVVPDYKTAASAEPGAFTRSAANFGYHLQAAHNLNGILINGLAHGAAWVFCVQEKEPPFVVTVVELDDTYLRIGNAQIAEAIRVYLQCIAAGRWGGYSDDVVQVAPPRWLTAQYE